MKMTYIEGQNGPIAVISPEEKVILDASSALDLAITSRYEGGARRLAIDKAAAAEEFFILSTGLTGEILQKFTKYHIKAAFYGDFSHYTSKPLKDFLCESNQGSSMFFVLPREDALRRLSEATA